MSSFHSHPLGIITLIAHCLQCASALIVLGITAWAVRGTKNLTVIYTLVIVSCEIHHCDKVGVVSLAPTI